MHWLVAKSEQVQRCTTIASSLTGSNSISSAGTLLSLPQAAKMPKTAFPVAMRPPSDDRISGQDQAAFSNLSVRFFRTAGLGVRSGDIIAERRDASAIRELLLKSAPTTIATLRSTYETAFSHTRDRR